MTVYENAQTRLGRDFRRPLVDFEALHRNRRRRELARCKRVRMGREEKEERENYVP